jgi:lysophospholipase L1-like esterase
VALRETKRVLVITDSIGKYLEDIWYMELVAVRGARINSMKTMIKNKEINLSLYSHIIIHLGTNDIVNSTTDKIIADESSCILLIKSTDSLVNIFISSILPRPVDFNYTGPKCKSINLLICKICSQYNVHFIPSYKIFFNKAIPVRSLYAINDGGLHLNEAGQYELRRCFQHAINHM